MPAFKEFHPIEMGLYASSIARFTLKTWAIHLGDSLGPLEGLRTTQNRLVDHGIMNKSEVKRRKVAPLPCRSSSSSTLPSFGFLGWNRSAPVIFPSL
jgi:hypothetical protein